MAKRILASTLFFFFVFFGAHAKASDDNVINLHDLSFFLRCRLTYHVDYHFNTTQGHTWKEDFYYNGKNIESATFLFPVGQINSLKVRLSPRSEKDLFSVFIEVYVGNMQICSPSLTHTFGEIRVKIFATLDKNGVLAEDLDEKLRKYTSLIKNGSKATGRIIAVNTKRNPYSIMPHEVTFFVLIDALESK